MKIFFTGMIFWIAGCSQPSPDRSLPEPELARVRAVIQTYAEAWKSMDSSGVLGLFTEDAVISPSGLQPKEGKQALRDFWFPDDGSVTTVEHYVIEVLASGGTGSWAFTHELGDLTFGYTKGDFSMSKRSRAYATTIYQKEPDGIWRIQHRMWTDLRAEP